MFFKKNKADVYQAPITGKLATLASLKDGVFSKKMMGDGLVVKFDPQLQEGKVYAPVGGKLVTVFPTGHAYGIQTKAGVELLIHIGLDTVNLKGEGFQAHVHQGQKVKAGTLLATVALADIKAKVPALDPIVIVTSGQKIEVVAKGDVEQGAELFKVL